MKSRIVLYYSRTGNNKFLAERIAEELDADIRPLGARVKGTGLLYFLSLLKWSSGIDLKEKDLLPFEEVVVVGPVWGGLLIAPLRDAIRKSVNASRVIHFATCCGISDEMKNHRYGYAQVLEAARKAGKGLLKTAAAFPVGLALPEETDSDEGELMKIRLTDDNYTNRLRERVERFTKQIKAVLVSTVH